MNFHSQQQQQMNNEMRTRFCCPLSFCCSLEHTTVQDCNHPLKFQFVEPLHNIILQNIQQKIPVEQTTNIDDEIINNILYSIQQIYFREPMDNEQLEILLFRLKVPTFLYWRVFYEEKIEIVLDAYRKIIYSFIQPTVIEEIDVSLTEEEDDDLYMDETIILENPSNSNPSIEFLYKGEPNEEMKQHECPICYETGCFIQVIHCSHLFCNCLITYIIKKNEIREKVGCPCCRQEIKELGVYNN